MAIRFLIIYASFVIVLAIIVAFITGPLWGLPLDYEKGQHLQLIQIAVPPFIAYLSAAVAYAKAGHLFPEPEGERGRILRTVCLGGIAVFVVGFTVGTYVFYETGRGALPSGGLSYGQYSALITTILAILGATTSAVSALVFATRRTR